MRHRISALFALLFLAVPTFAAVTGTVMTPDGQPVAGARVSLYAIETAELRRTRYLSANPEAVPLASTQADTKGNFSLPSPKDALVDLRVTAPGYEPWQRRVERDEEAGAIALPRAETKRGTVKANGKPVANATVALNYAGPEYLVKTDAEGRFEAPDPKKARAIVIVHPDYAIVDENAPSFTSGITNLNRTLVPATPINGRVVREDGTTPVAKATIYVDGWPLATSSEDGSFSATRAPAKWTTVIAQSGSLIGKRMQTKEQPLVVKVSRAATISGRVLDSKAKVPIVGAFARVSTRGMRQNESWWGALTDAKGNYTLTVTPGAYNLFVGHPAYDSRGMDISATSGQTTSKEIILTPLSRVRGVVVDDERKPVAVANIAAQDARDDFPMQRAMRETAVSGPDGRFSMRVRSESELKLRATKKGLPSVTSESFKLAAGERKSNVVLTIPSGIAVTGKVTDRDGNPLSGVSVTSQQAATGQRAMMQRVIGMPSSGDEDTVKTASDGTFTLRLTEGNYDFSFRREGFAAKHVRGKSVTVSGPNMVETSLEPSVEVSGRVTRGGAGVEGVTVMSFAEGEPSDTITGPDGSFVLTGLTPGGARIVLRKEDELINENRAITAPARDVVIELPVGTRVSGRVVDKSTRKPLTAFEVGVSISRSGGGMVMMAPPLTRSFTSEDGSFTLENVPLGAVNFIASAAGYSSARLNLNLEEGKPVTNLEVELDTGVKLVGKITGPDGTALSDASVRVAMFAAPGTVVRSGPGRFTTTNSSGEYELDALEPGEETIEISHPKYLTERKSVQLKGREVRLDAQLTSGHRVTGVVVTDSGAPVAEADVEAFPAGGMMKRTKTDAGGRFEMESMSPSRYQFRASKAGYAEGSVKDFDVASGAQVRIVLASGGTLYGVVRGLTEAELAQTMVEVRGSDSMTSAPVDSTGNYKVEGVPAGTVQVRASSTGRGFTGRKSSQLQTVEMTAGSSRQLDIEFRNDTVISGRVRRNGQPMPGAVVNFIPKPGGQQTSATVGADEQGNYTINGLENGEYNVVVSDMQRFTSYSTTYEVRGSATFDIDHTAHSLRGRVVDATSGGPVDAARVQLRGNNPQSASMRFAERVAVTDTNGVFNLDLVAPGSYLLTADKDGFGNQVLDLVVTDRAMENVELRLPRNEGITLNVIDARDHRPLSASVIVFDPQGRLVHEERGFFQPDNKSNIRLPLAAGTYTATIAAMGYGTRTVSLRSPSSQTVPLMVAAKIVVRSKHSERRRARLIDANGMPYPRWSAQLPQIFLNPSPGTTTLESIAGGSYTLQLLGDNDMVLDSKPVVVADGGIVEVEI